MREDDKCTRGARHVPVSLQDRLAVERILRRVGTARLGAWARPRHGGQGMSRDSIHRRLILRVPVG